MSEKQKTQATPGAKDPQATAPGSPNKIDVKTAVLVTQNLKLRAIKAFLSAGPGKDPKSQKTFNKVTQATADLKPLTGKPGKFWQLDSALNKILEIINP